MNHKGNYQLKVEVEKLKVEWDIKNQTRQGFTLVDSCDLGEMVELYFAKHEVINSGPILQ